MRYPTASEVELGLKGVAAELGEQSSAPFRVGMLPEVEEVEGVQPHDTTSIVDRGTSSDFSTSSR